MGSDDFTVLISLTDTLKVPLKILVEFFMESMKVFYGMNTKERRAIPLPI